MAYKTTTAIRDLQDNEYCYYEGAVYPRHGLEVSANRIDELLKKGVIKKDDVEVEESSTEKLPSTKEIKEKLDNLGIKYKSKASKTELLSLLEEASLE